MLYEQWQLISRTRASEKALWDFSSGQSWTFAELEREAEKTPADSSAVATPSGISSGFVLAVLRAWRTGQVVCPLEAGQAAPLFTTTPPKGAVHLKTTSATTGSARLVYFTAEQLKADADNIVQTMGLRPDWPNLGVISLAHSYGFSNLITPLLLHGIPLVIAPGPLPEIVRKAAAVCPSITLPAVPAMWRAWMDAQALSSNIRLAISAGAPLPIPLEEEIFRKTGLKLHNFYGSTECGGIAYDRSTVPRSDPAMVGQGMDHVHLSANAQGCLEVRSAAVAEGYWPEPAPNLKAGCFTTTDLVEIKDNSVHLRGRMTDQINVAGRKISPESIECALLEHEHVRDCLVFGIPSQDNGRVEEIVACVATSAAPESLKQFLLARLPAWQVPRDWWLLDSLEANQRGKLSRAEWRKKYLANRG
ncbi:MAG TPA: fatty acid--CoA ligase family protein [Candidatus Saccharimonadales bacterium]|nr:fatty acid--CoA ligase family protein [Candidatus Saccharimonadales bacterium]